MMEPNVKTWERLAKSMATGAAAGSILPGLGTALGAVGGIALDLAPEIGRWLFGADAAPTVAAVAEAVAAVTGTTDPAAQSEALQDPAAAAQFRVQLAGIAAGRAAAADAAALSRLQAVLQDVASARAMAVAAPSGSPLAWGAPVVSLVVLLTFGAVMTLALFQELPPRSEALVNVLLGTLAAMATSVVAYWVGSSVGSARKDDRLAKLGG